MRVNFKLEVNQNDFILVCVLPSPPLEECQRCTQLAAQYLGRHVQDYPVPYTKGSSLFSISGVHGVCGPRIASGVPRALCLPEKGTSILHLVHCRLVLVHSFAGFTHAPISGFDDAFRSNFDEFCFGSVSVLERKYFTVNSTGSHCDDP